MSDTEQMAARGIRFGGLGWLSGQQAAAIAEDVVAALREANMLREGPDVGDMLDALLAAPDDITIAKHAIQDGTVIEWQVWDGYGETYTAQSWREALTAAYQALQEGTP